MQLYSLYTNILIQYLTKKQIQREYLFPVIPVPKVQPNYNPNLKYDNEILYERTSSTTSKQKLAWAIVVHIA